MDKYIFCGSTVKPGQGGSRDWIDIFSFDSFKELTGRDYKYNEFGICAYNADHGANDVEIIGVRVVNSEKRIDAMLDKPTPNNVRVGWCVMVKQ